MTVILDNVSFHRGKKLLLIVEWVGVFLLFLSAYLPVFNCIECRWANLKRVLSDLMPECETLQEAVYTHFEEYNS
ncbi:MAG: transposase [Nitrososphaerota archaeon]|nr:transposase [Nitrososphaerota archaeon]